MSRAVGSILIGTALGFACAASIGHAIEADGMGYAIIAGLCGGAIAAGLMILSQK